MSRVPQKFTKEELTLLAKKGMIAPEIARKLKVSTTSIRQWAKEWDIPLVFRTHIRNPELTKEAVERYQKGESIHSLTLRFRCCRKTLITVLEEEEVYDKPLLPVPSQGTHLLHLAMAAEAAVFGHILPPPLVKKVKAAIKVYRKYLTDLRDPSDLM
jgi:hypothetical protein